MYQLIIDKIVLASGQAIAWFDRAVVNDSGVNGTGEATDFAAKLAKYSQTGKIPNYALGIVIGVVVITIVAFGYRT